MERLIVASSQSDSADGRGKLASIVISLPRLSSSVIIARPSEQNWSVGAWHQLSVFVQTS